MLKRDVEKEINEWILNDKRALLIDGARQVGKTFIIRQCLEESSYTFIEYNLINDEKVVDIIKNSNNTDDLILKLSLNTDKKVVPNKTIFFFDENHHLQKCAMIAWL